MKEQHKKYVLLHKCFGAVKYFLTYLSKNWLPVITIIVAISSFITTRQSMINSVRQRDDNNYRSNADFYRDLRKKYFTDEFRDMLVLLDMNCMIFIYNANDTTYINEVFQQYKAILPKDFKKRIYGKFPDNFPIFWIKKEHKLTENFQNREYFTSYEVDDILMNGLDDLGEFFKNGIISDTNLVYNGFGWYIQTVWESAAIKQYILWLRSNYYDESAHMHGVESLYRIMRKNFITSSYNKKIPLNYYCDSFIVNNALLCKNDTFVWARPINKKFQHEVEQIVGN